MCHQVIRGLIMHESIIKSSPIKNTYIIHNLLYALTKNNNIISSTNSTIVQIVQ